MNEPMDFTDELRADAASLSSHPYTCDLLIRAASEIERLLAGQAVIAKQVGFYKPDTPDFEFVSVPLGILRRALRCDPPPYPEDVLDDLATTERGLPACEQT